MGIDSLGIQNDYTRLTLFYSQAPCATVLLFLADLRGMQPGEDEAAAAMSSSECLRLALRGKGLLLLSAVPGRMGVAGEVAGWAAGMFSITFEKRLY